MIEELKEDLVESVKTAADVINDEEAMAILEICRRAMDREIAEISERQLINALKTDDKKEGDSK